MITRTELRTLAVARLTDSQILFAGQRYDAAAYLCGYAIELALKARICKTLRWPNFPDTNKEFLQMVCDMTGKSLTSRRFRKLYELDKSDFCKYYELYFQNARFLKTHDLNTLLLFSGVKEKIKSQFLLEWSVVERWNPENRYEPLGLHTQQTVLDMFTATETLLKILK